MNNFYKKVAPQPKPCVTVRELVTKWGDDWALMAPTDSRHWASVMADRPSDFRESVLVSMMERGQMSRINVLDLMSQ